MENTITPEIFEQTAVDRLIEFTAELRPHLLNEIPFIIAVAQVFHQRKLKEMEKPNEKH